MARDWSDRTAALAYFEKQLRWAKQCNDDNKGFIAEAVNAMRRSQDHTAIQNKLNAAMKLIRKIAENPDCSSATCGLDCKEFLGSSDTRTKEHE